MPGKIIFDSRPEMLYGADKNTPYRYSIVAGKPFGPNGNLGMFAPSKQLWYQYLDWKKEGQWPEQFADGYAKQFLQEQSQSETAQDMYNRLVNRKLDDDIAMACYCQDWDSCHRLLVAKNLVDKGAQNVFIRDGDQLMTPDDAVAQVPGLTELFANLFAKAMVK